MKECTACGESKDFNSFYLLNGKPRSICKRCAREKDKERRKRRRENNPIRFIANTMAKNILNRTNPEIAKENYKSYYKKNIKCALGSNAEEITDLILRYFKNDIENIVKIGGTPSIDRINPDGDYELNNIRVIDRIENSRIAAIKNNQERKRKVKAIFPTGEEILFSSVADAASYFGIERSAIRYHIEHNGATRDGIKFESEAK